MCRGTGGWVRVAQVGAGFHLGHNIEEARAALALVDVALADVVLLRMAGHLRRSPRLHEVPGDPTPVALGQRARRQRGEIPIACGEAIRGGPSAEGRGTESRGGTTTQSHVIPAGRNHASVCKQGRGAFL